MKKTDKINAKIIAKFNPCDSRFDNYLKHYSNFDGDLKDFILLENISYSDKVWVVTRMFTRMQNIKWSLLCASKVLSIFESRYPNDDRPRKALKATETYLNNPTTANANAARAAADAAATYAADADDAADAAYAAADADSAAADAAAAYAAYAAAYAADAAAAAAYDAADADSAATHAAARAAADAADAAASRNIEEEVNLLLMIECLE